MIILKIMIITIIKKHIPPVMKYTTNKYRGRRRERINTKRDVGGKNTLVSLTTWSTQVADSQETDLIMLLVTMLCPYSGWHHRWQRPPVHSNQETKCRGAPQSPVGESLADHLPGTRKNSRGEHSPDTQYSTIRQTGLIFHLGDWGSPEGEGRSWPTDRQTERQPGCLAWPSHQGWA